MLDVDKMPVLIGIEFAYSESGAVLPTIQYMEPDQHEHAREIRSLSFAPAELGEHIEDAVDEFQLNLVRLIDAVKEATRLRPVSIPSRKAQQEQIEGDE